VANRENRLIHSSSFLFIRSAVSSYKLFHNFNDLIFVCAIEGDLDLFAAQALQGGLIGVDVQQAAIEAAVGRTQTQFFGQLGFGLKGYEPSSILHIVDQLPYLCAAERGARQDYELVSGQELIVLPR